MSVEPGLIAFAAFTSLALAMRKHRPGAPSPALPPPAAARVLGWLLLGVSAIAAVLGYGAGLGAVTWIGQASVAVALLALLLSWRPSAAPILAGLALVSAPLVALI